MRALIRRLPSDDVDTPTHRGLGGALLAAAILSFATGPIGVLAGVTVLGSAVVAPSPYAFAVGNVWVGSLGISRPLALVGVELGLGVLLVGDFTSRTWHFSAGVLGAFAFLAALGYHLTAQLAARWQATLAFVLCIGVVGYGLHRYERLTVGNPDA